MNPRGNLFKINSQANTNSELFETLFDGNIRIERIISIGQITPENEWYDQDKDEWVTLLQGEAELEIENSEIVQLKAGDYIFLPSNCRHRVARTSENSPCIWLAIHGNLRNKL